MGYLESIKTPRDLRELTPGQLSDLASEIRDFLIETCSRTGGHLGPNLGVVELTLAIHRTFDSPTDRIVFDTGHQAYVHKLLTGRVAGLRQAPPGGRGQWLPQPAGVRPRHRGELPRVDGAELRRRAGQGLRHPRRGPARRSGHRRRCAHRRDGLGGAQQHRDRQGQPTGDRRQRQRPLVHPDRRRALARAHQPAHEPALRTTARAGQEASQRRAGSRSGGVRRPPRHEEGHEGRARASGPLRGPRPEVRRTGRRPRPGGHGAGSRPGKEVQRPGDRARDHPQGLRVRRGRTARGRPVPLTGPVRRRHRGGNPEGPDLDRRVRRRDRAPRRAAPGAGRDHGGDDPPGGARQVRGPLPRPILRRRHRRTARRDLGGRACDGRAAPRRRPLRHLPEPSLRPGPDGRRAAQVRGHLRARPVGSDRRRRGQPQRHVGHVDPAGRAGPAPFRPP